MSAIPSGDPLLLEPLPKRLEVKHLQALCPRGHENYAWMVTNAASLLHHGRIPVRHPTDDRLTADLMLLCPLLPAWSAREYAKRIARWSSQASTREGALQDALNAGQPA